MKLHGPQTMILGGNRRSPTARAVSLLWSAKPGSSNLYPLGLCILSVALSSGQGPDAFKQAQAKPPTREEPSGETLVGYMGSAGASRPKEVWLTGSWRPGTGWTIAQRQWATSLRVEQWSGFPAPDGPLEIVRTRPKPLTEPDDGEVRFALTSPAKEGLVTTARGEIRPRKAKPFDGSYADLKRWTSGLLRQHQVRKPAAARITGAWRVDLDGNGMDEILWTARSREGWSAPYRDAAIPGHALASDYALLALSYRNGKGRVHRALAVGGPEAAAPSYRILCPLDLDRDGRLEVYARAAYFEDHRMLAFTFDGKRVHGILGTPLPNAAGSVRAEGE